MFIKVSALVGNMATETNEIKGSYINWTYTCVGGRTQCETVRNFRL